MAKFNSEKQIRTKRNLGWKEKYYDTYTHKQKKTKTNGGKYDNRIITAWSSRFHRSMPANWDAVHRAGAVFVADKDFEKVQSQDKIQRKRIIL